MKKMLLVGALFFIFWAMPYKAEAAGTFTIGSTNFVIDGQQQIMDVAPYIKGDRTFLPVRYAAYALGISDSNIVWDNTSQTVTLLKGSAVVKLKVGSNVMLNSGNAFEMDVAPEIIMGRVMLPIRYIANAFSSSISWNPDTLTVAVGNTLENSGNPSPTISPDQSFDVTVPSLSYNNVKNDYKDLDWIYGGNNFKWHVEVPDDLLTWDRKTNNITKQFYNSNGIEQYQMQNSMQDNINALVLSNSTSANLNLTPWVNDTNNSQWVGNLANDLSAIAQSKGYDYFHTAEFVQSFVGGAIPYKLTQYPELPAQTVFDNGDCKDKSILLASILKNMGYKVALLGFYPQPGTTTGHMAVGIVLNDNQIPTDRSASYYLLGGTKYYFAETTEPYWHIGQISDDKMEKQGYVYPLN